jgi:hypothetical protein
MRNFPLGAGREPCAVPAKSSYVTERPHTPRITSSAVGGSVSFAGFRGGTIHFHVIPRSRLWRAIVALIAVGIAVGL